MARAKKATKKKKSKKRAFKEFVYVKPLELMSTGSTMLNLAISNKLFGGYPIGRMTNIVGDKSSGKTLLAIEAMAYAIRKLAKKGHQTIVARYTESESAFDKPYAKQLGLPVEEIEFPNDTAEGEEKAIHTVEDLYKDLLAQIKRHADGEFDSMVYIIDSFDGLTSEDELKTDIDKGTYGGSKPKKMNELFRRLVNKLEQANITFIIVSHMKDKIGVSFGEKKTRTGGKALDFYASVIIWLHELGKHKKGSGSRERVVGLKVRAKVKKNKVWVPFREADYNILFNYGIDDVGSMLDFLKVNKDTTGWYTGTRFVFEGKLLKKGKKPKKKVKGYTRDKFIELMEDDKKNMKSLKKEVKRVWKDIEDSVAVKRKPKY